MGSEMCIRDSLWLTNGDIRTWPAPRTTAFNEPDENLGHYFLQVTLRSRRRGAVAEPVTDRHVTDIIVQALLTIFSYMKLTTHNDRDFNLSTIQPSITCLQQVSLSRKTRGTSSGVARSLKSSIFIGSYLCRHQPPFLQPRRQ